MLYCRIVSRGVAKIGKAKLLSVLLAVVLFSSVFSFASASAAEQSSAANWLSKAASFLFGAGKSTTVTGYQVSESEGGSSAAGSPTAGSTGLSSGLASPCGSFGDVNSDGIVSKEDSDIIAKYVVGSVQFTDSQLKSGDLNVDGKVSIADAGYVLQYVEGKRTTFPACSAGTSSTDSGSGGGGSTAKTCAELSASQEYFFDLCGKEGYDNVCLNRFSGEYRGCTKSSNNDCTANNANADKNILCAVPNETSTPKCTDSDGGKDYYVKGTAVGDFIFHGEVSPVKSVTDTCNGDDVVVENYCNSDGYRDSEPYHECPNGCKDGACLKGGSPAVMEVIGTTVRDTLKLKEAKLYSIKESKEALGKTYDASLDFVGSGGAAFTINGQYTYVITPGNGKVLADGSEFKVHSVSSDMGASEFSIAIAPAAVKEQVKCVFANSASQQKCYSDNGRFSCSGTESCVVDVSGNTGTKLTWKSSCGGYAYTTIDGKSEHAEFKCEPAAAKLSCSDSDGGISYHSKGTVKYNLNFDEKYRYELVDSCSGSTLSEYYCDANGNANGNAQTTYFSCPYGCNEGACLKQEVPAAAAAGSCPSRIGFAFDSSSYNYGDSYAYKVATYDSAGNLAGAELDVVVEHNGKVETSTILTKPSGTYATSGVVSGTLEGMYLFTVKSKPYCQNSVMALARVTVGSKGSAGGKGFTGASWQCYDSTGGGSAASEGVCYTETELRSRAEEACAGRCATISTAAGGGGGGGSGGVAKCGVNSFSVSGDCSSSPPVEETIPPEVPERSYVYEVRMKKGWNLVSVLSLFALGGEVSDSSSSTTCSWLQGSLGQGSSAESYVKKNMFSYDPFGRRYIRLEELNSLKTPSAGDYLASSSFNSFWLRSTEDCSITVGLTSAAKNGNELLSKFMQRISDNNYKLVKGWNFFSVWPEMEGKTLEDIKGGCEVKKAYAYDPFSNRWASLKGVEFSHDAVGYGFVMKVADECVLGSSSALPPSLPEDDDSSRNVEAKKAGITATATAVSNTKLG